MNVTTSSIVKRTGVILSVLLLTACSSAPDHVTASRPLVESVNYSHQTEVPSEFWSALNNNKGNYAFTYNGKTINVHPEYLSALGNFCRPVIASDNLGKHKRVVCKARANESWYLVPDIIHSEGD
ncbi:hypothetical protein P3371_24785, partial [Vibrio parahaemolyticus]|nr:hypothetical protein [Vibrio parahaemolyticus]